MDFIVMLDHTKRQHDLIWVIMDRQTQFAHFLPFNVIYSAENYDKFKIKEIMMFDGSPLSFISDKGSQFTSHFWKSFVRPPKNC